MVIPGGGIPMLLFAKQGIYEIAGAPLLNGLQALLETAETAVNLHRSTGVAAGRVSNFKHPPREIVQYFQRVWPSEPGLS